MADSRSMAPTFNVLMVAQAVSLGMSEFEIRRKLETKHGIPREETASLYKEGKAHFKGLVLGRPW